MFFQETTPDTSGYMIAGYVIAFLVMALYVVSIYLRTRNLNQDIAMLNEMEETTSAVQAGFAGRPKKNPAHSGNNRSAKTVTKKTSKK